MRAITIMITEGGDQIFLDSPGAAVFCEAGSSTMRRASNILPDALLLRLLFLAIRAVVPDTSRLAGWTRSWQCLWRIDTSPVGGPILAARYNVRANAIEAEIRFLNEYFMEKK